MEAVVKVFAMNDCEWYAGADLESCIKDYFELISEDDTPENREEFLEPYELSEDDMNRLKYNDFEGELNDGVAGVYTFREALDKMIAQGHKAPFYFACTEY